VETSGNLLSLFGWGVGAVAECCKALLERENKNEKTQKDPWFATGQGTLRKDGKLQSVMES